VYDDKGEIISTNALLDVNVPDLPMGVLNYTRDHKEDRLTWQPKVGVRAAIAVVRSAGVKPGFVLAGQSLREVEKLEDRILFDVIVGWAVTMAGTLIATYLIGR
jgi:hypothetical protein